MLRATLGGFSMGRKFKPAEGSNIKDILRMPRPSKSYAQGCLAADRLFAFLFTFVKHP